MNIHRFFLFVAASLFVLQGMRAQTITTLYVDVLGNQPVHVDTMGPSGKQKAFVRDAEKQFAIGLRLCGMNLERRLHFSFLFAYRVVTLENLHLVNQANVNKYEQEKLFELMGGVTYFTKSGLRIGKTVTHFSANALAGFQTFAFGASVGGGLTILSESGLAGVTIEFVYRPVAYEIENRSEAFVPDPYYVKLLPSNGFSG